MTYDGLIDSTSTRQQKPNMTLNKEGRYSSVRINYPWKSRTVGLALIYPYARKYGSDDQLLLKKPSELGIKFSSMLIWITERYPQLLEDHLSVTSKPLSKNKLEGRLANMFRDNDRRRFAFGDEHPKNNPALKAVLDAVINRLKEAGDSVTALHNWTPEIEVK